MKRAMTVDEGLRGLAGTIVLVSLALGYWVHPAFLLLTAFVGANLLQSAFSRTCPAMAVLRWLGLRDTNAEPKPVATGSGPTT